MSSRMTTSNRSSRRSARGRSRFALGSEQLLHELERRREKDALAGLDECVPERADRVALADAGKAEGENIDGALGEVAACELAELLRERASQSSIFERREGLARRQMRRATQPVHSPLTTVAGLQLEYLGKQREEISVAGLENPRHELRGECRQPKLGAQLTESLSDHQRVGCCSSHAAPPTRRWS